MALDRGAVSVQKRAGGAGVSARCAETAREAVVFPRASARHPDPEVREVELVFILIGIVIAVAIAAWCASIAAGKGRSPILWGILGFVFPLIALIVIAVLPAASPPAAG